MNRFTLNVALGSVMALGLLAVPLLMPIEAAASAYGPMDNCAGNPPLNLNCTLCHGDYPLNSGNGGLEILNLPATFVPGNSYDLIVRVFDPDQSRWGFELTALDAAHQMAGEILVADPVTTELSDQPGTSPDFLKQTFAGTHWGVADGPVAWPFRWTAPSLPSVTFYAAACAADGTEDPGLDFVYVREIVVPQGTTATEEGSWGRIKALFSHDVDR